MSAATTLSKRALVDIAPNGRQPHLSLGHGFMAGFGSADAGVVGLEPPPKRLRLKDDVSARRQTLKMRLQEQVLPHVSRAVECLPADLYEVDDIAVRVRKHKATFSRNKG